CTGAAVAYHIAGFVFFRFDHSSEEIPAVVDQRKWRRYRLVQNQGAGGIIEHQARPPGIKRKVQDRLARPLPGVKDWAESITHRINGGVHPATHNDPLPQLGEDGTVVHNMKIGSLRSGVVEI